MKPAELDILIATWLATTDKKSAKSLADFLGVKISQLARWLNNHRALKDIMQVAFDAFDVPPAGKYPFNPCGFGQPRIFSSPEQLWSLCQDYFEWIEENPLLEAKTFCHKGLLVKDEVPRMRAMSIRGLCVHLGMNVDTWYDYKKKDEFKEVVNHVSTLIFNQKFEGAAGGQLNALIISRDLGLVEQSKNQMVGGDEDDAPISQDIRVTLVKPGDIVK